MNESHFELIDKYYRDLLDEQERSQFDQRRQSDPTFRAEVEQYLQERAAIALHTRDILKDEATQIYSEHDRTRRLTRRRYLSIAAGFALIVAAGGWWISQQSPGQTTSDLYAQYFEIPAPSVPRGDSIPAAWQEAIAAYEDGNYAVALTRFDNTLRTEQIATEAQTYLLMGICQLQEGNPENAISRFAMVDSGSVYFAQAKWFMAMAYLKMNDVELAKTYFEQVRDAGNYQKRAAAEILDALE